MHEDFAEAPGQPLVLLGVERLVAEEDHAVIEQGLADLRDRRVVEVGAEVDARELGAESAVDGVHLEPGRRLHERPPDGRSIATHRDLTGRWLLM